MSDAVAGPPLIAVAHGSRDPRSAAAVAAMVRDLAAAHPGIEVHLAFLDLSVPSLGDVVATLARAGHTRAVVVPLLLGSAYHSRVDLPALIAAAEARHPGLELVQAPVLGDDERLVTAVRDRIVAAGSDPADPSVGVALAAVGSSSAEANAVTRALALRVQHGTAWAAAEVCFAAAAEPGVEAAIARLRDAGARRIVLGSWFLAPGLLTDRVRRRAVEAEPSVLLAEPIGAHALVPQVIAERYRRAAGATPSVSGARPDAISAA